MTNKVTPDHLRRRAIVYVRHCTLIQVSQNRESQLRQYHLAGYARELGFADVEIIDEDLGRSGSGLVERPGFQRLVTEVCEGQIGAVFCLEASRLARNGRLAPSDRTVRVGGCRADRSRGDLRSAGDQ